MCGIAAVVRLSASASQLSGVAQALISRVAHRGPDGEAVMHLAWADGRITAVEARGPWDVALAHRRLSIIDLSAAANQPMRRDSVWITYNGELYNHVELRAELEALGARFTTHSDTEVLLAAWKQWGRDAFRRCKGMWGFVLVDPSARRQVVASRDRLGIKPLYVFERGGARYFVSEIKQLLALGASLECDTSALTSYLATGYEDSTRSFFMGVVPVAPGTTVAWSLDDGKLLGSESYWNPETIRSGCDDPDEAGAPPRGGAARRSSSRAPAQRRARRVRAERRSRFDLGRRAGPFAGALERPQHVHRDFPRRRHR